jgi:hypothetical protein
MRHLSRISSYLVAGGAVAAIGEAIVVHLVATRALVIDSPQGRGTRIASEFPCAS